MPDWLLVAEASRTCPMCHRWAEMAAAIFEGGSTASAEGLGPVPTPDGAEGSCAVVRRDDVG